MEAPRYTASKTLAKDGAFWVMGFRHPQKKDARGKQGRKMRRGLNTSNEIEAQALVDQMNILLGDSTWHSVDRLNEAQRKFHPIIVRAFYDELDAPTSNSWEIRNEVIPLPPRGEKYTRVLLVGTTGAGKTSLLRQLIGSHPDRDRFPSTSASRTTIADTEIICSQKNEYTAVVTFFSEPTIHTYIHECVASACSLLWDEQGDDALAERLLTHRDLRFRMNYILGSWKPELSNPEEVGDGWDADLEKTNEFLSENDAMSLSFDERRKMSGIISGYLQQIRSIVKQAKQRLFDGVKDILNLVGRDRDAAQDLFEETLTTIPDFDELVNDIMEEISSRLEALPSPGLKTYANNWPRSWVYKSEDRDSFIRVIRKFSSNYSPAFGALLTPLVDGIRIEGQFSPKMVDGDHRLVLMDGEGLYHADDNVSAITSRITRRFEDVDVILLVDSAKAPMLDAPTSLLRAVASSGHQKKFAIAFTHFDLMRGQANLPTFSMQRAHVLSAVRQKLSGLRAVVGIPALRPIERELEDRCFMLGFLDKELTKLQRGPTKEIEGLLAFFKRAILTSELEEICPIYDTAGLVLAIQSATANFHYRWDSILGFKSSTDIRTAHWAKIKALNRRIVMNIENCEYGNLMPVADLGGRLSDSITIFLQKPHKWHPRQPSDIEAEEALSRIQREVSKRLEDFSTTKLLRIPRPQWMEAFEHSGNRSTYLRASDIRSIYQSSAPIPGPALNANSEQFLRDIRTLVYEAVRTGGGKLESDILANP